LEKELIVKQNLVRFILSVATISILISVAPLVAQQAMTLKFNSEDTFIIPELGAIVKQTKDTLAVTMMMPGGAKEYAGIDVKIGDLVTAVSGTSVKSIKTLRTAYSALKVGATVKLVTLREGVSKTLTYKKADESKLPGPKIIRKTVGDKADTSGKCGK
jgi:S1-C subfamily serine protease